MIIEEIYLFEGISNATLTAYIQDSFQEYQSITERPAVILCPGGAFLGITEKEAEPVALQFIAEGYQVFLLRYSVGLEAARLPNPMIDAAKAISFVRENAKRWYINPNKIILTGFSTGGFVAAALGATWQEDYLSKALNVDNSILKPNALLLAYPILDMKLLQEQLKNKSQEMQTLIEMMFQVIYGTQYPNQAQLDEWKIRRRITASMPPTFLWSTTEDGIIGNSANLEFVQILNAINIPYEFHLFQLGPHGISLGDYRVGYSEKQVKSFGNSIKWIDMALNWISDLFGG